MRKGLLAYLTPVFAIGLAIVVGYYSVTGLSKLFAGAATAVIILGAILESVKVLGTALLHVYWKKFSLLVKVYMIMGVIVLMGITSAGVYGLLTSAYQATSNQLKVDNKEVQLVENKKIVFNGKISTLNQQLEYKNTQINTLVGLRTQQETRLDSLLSQGHWTNAKRTQEQIANASSDIKILQGDVDTILVKVGSFNDSIANLEITILNIQTNSEAATELGPLMYVAELTGKPMDEVINWFMLLIIFVADPFALILIIVTTKIWKREEDDNSEPTVPPIVLTPPIVSPPMVTPTTPNSKGNSKYIKPTQPVAVTPSPPLKKSKWHGVHNPKQARNKKGTP